MPRAAANVGGKVREVEVSLGLTVEINGIWYRPNARLVIEMNEENTESIRKKAFNQAFDELSKVIEHQIRTLSTDQQTE